MKIASRIGWPLALIGNVIILSGFANIPYWIPVSLAILSIILFFAQASIEKVPAYGFLVATLLFFNWTFGEWVYRTWEAHSLFIEPIVVTRIFIVIGFSMTVFIIFAYHRHFYSFKRSKGRTREVRKMEVFAPYAEMWDRLLGRLKNVSEDNNNEQETIYFTLGEVVQEDE